MSRIGGVLKEWRALRRTSQLDLANAAGISQRHLSFVESGRSEPSEALVLSLAELLGVGLRERNAFLVAAGYAPRFAESSWHSDALADVRRAAHLVLARHGADPALVLDVTTTILEANEAALTLLGATPSDLGKLNLVDLVFGPGPVRDAIVNWEQVAGYLLAKLREAALYRSASARVRPFYERALELARAQNLTPSLGAATGPLLPLSFRVNGEVRHWFTTVTTFGAPQDAFVEEITIELFHPHDPLAERASAPC